VFGFRKTTRRPIAEHEATGETERIYHEVRQTLRVTGVDLMFRVWTSYERFLPVLWSAVRANAETMAFEESADRMRVDLTRLAERLGPLELATRVRLGESQSFQLSAALDLYHYANPKLMVLASAVRLALDGEPLGRSGDGGLARLELGAPATMPPMEMVLEEPDDRRVREIFADLERTTGLRWVNSDYRTLALWPDYLAAAWEVLKPMTRRPQFTSSAEQVLESSRALARALPYPVPLTRARVAELGEDVEEIVELAKQMEQSLASLSLAVATIALDWRTPEVLARSPFPARPRNMVEQVQGGLS
jgi:hypothetical protein